MSKWTFWLITAIFAQLTVAVAMAEVPQQPLDIEADDLSLTFNQRTAVFSGNVSVIQGDMTLTCDQLTLNQAEDNSLGDVEAQGNVQLQRGEEHASGDKAVYQPSNGLLTLTGNVTLQRGSNTLVGETLQYDLANGTLKLQNGEDGNRVRANLNPDELNNEQTEETKTNAKPAAPASATAP